jgi:hypothetical protein
MKIEVSDPMKTTIFPEKIDNHYQGKRIALWVFAAVTVVTIARSLVHIIAADGGAQSIATIPLDTFTAAGARTVVLMFAYWGISQLLLGLVYLLVLLRYQSMIPLMYLFMAAEYALRLVVGWLKPIETTRMAPGAVGNYVLIPLALVMFWLARPGKFRKIDGTMS